jgi:hypothetical protein
MKKFLALTAILALAFVACEQPVDETNTGSSLPTLTIINSSSYDLTDVKFSGVAFSSPGSGDIPRNNQAVRELSVETEKVNYVTFVRKPDGSILQTSQVHNAAEEPTFRFNDNTVVDEVGNPNNRGKPLSQIKLQSKVAVEWGGLNVPKNDMVNIGETIVNTPTQFEFTLKNTGAGELALSGNSPVSVSGGNGAFSVVQPPSSTIASNSSLIFKINFNPNAVQSYNATVTISSDDPGGDFTFTVVAAGVAPKPIAVVYYGDTVISQSGTVGTIDAGEIYVTQSKNISVVIKNAGTDILTLDTANITVTGADTGAFVRTTTPGNSISVGNQASFTIECKPAKQGENNAVLTIPTNDTSHNPAVVYLKATGVTGTAVLELSQGTKIIGNNSLTPVDFGVVEAGFNNSLTFTIKNTTGNIPLELTGDPMVESDKAVFSVFTQPANKTINPEASVSFVLRYTPVTEGEDTGIITIANNSDTGQFTFHVKGTGYVKKPHITLKQGNTAINQSGDFDFGTILTGTDKDITFTIGNSGEAALNFDTVNNHQINITNNASGYFTVIQEPLSTTTVSPGSTTTFIIRFKPTTVVNNYNAYIQIKTNSETHGDFSFAIKGNGRAYVIGDTGPGGGIIFFASGGQFKECSGDLGFSNWNTSMATASGYSGGGFTDWHLPDMSELWDICVNVHDEGLGDYDDDFYWSSLENTNGYAAALDFWFYSDGWEAKPKTSFLAGIIAVRSFTIF